MAVQSLVSARRSTFALREERKPTLFRDTDLQRKRKTMFRDVERTNLAQ